MRGTASFGSGLRVVIETSAALTALVARIAAVGRIGVDTEADSMHCYREKVCLVQIGLPGADELVDPLAGLDLTALLEALAATEVVMHGADFDLRMLYRLGLGAPQSVFDTMIAARLNGAAKYGYAALVAEHFGVVLPKGLQTANWARRPLAPRLAEYARNDTHYLLPLAERLEAGTRSAGPPRMAGAVVSPRGGRRAHRSRAGLRNRVARKGQLRARAARKRGPARAVALA